MPRRFAFAAFLLAWIPYSFLAYRFWHNVDDAFISFRYARNWALGHGLRYNLGPQQPEEGYSNFLWVAVCALVESLELDVTFWSPMLGFACGSLLLYLVFRTLRRDLGMGLGVAFSVTLGLGLFPPYALWSTGGLGTMAFALSTFATAYFLILRSAGISPYRGALAGVAMALLRTEGIAWALLFAVLGIVTRRMRREEVWKPIAVYVALVVSAFAVYFAWRFSYYQLLFPNTVYAKVDFSPGVALRGFRYVASFALTFLTPLPLLLAAGFAAWRKAPKPLALALGSLCLAFPAYAVAIGGDWMPMGRFLVPSFAFGALLMGWSVTCVGALGRIAVATAAVIAVGLLPAWNIHLVPESVHRQFHFRYGDGVACTEYDEWRQYKELEEVRKEVALALKTHLNQEGDIVLNAIGVIGYYSDLRIHDRYGLVDRRVAMRPRDPRIELKSPGHDSQVESGFFLQDEPEIVLYQLTEAESEAELLRKVRIRTEAWWNADPWPGVARPIWLSYAPAFLPLKPSPEGRLRAFLILRRIKEDPHIATLPALERNRTRKRRGEKMWGDFFAGLDSASPHAVYGNV